MNKVARTVRLFERYFCVLLFHRSSIKAWTQNEVSHNGRGKRQEIKTERRACSTQNVSARISPLSNVLFFAFFKSIRANSSIRLRDVSYCT